MCKETVELTGLCDCVADVARAVFAILEADLCLAGALNGDGERAGTSLPGPHIELTRLSLSTPLQPGASCVHAVSPSVTQRPHRELEWRSYTITDIVKL